MSSFGPRFAIELVFLGLLSLAAGLAELDTVWIVVVMTVGWLLVALVEWLAWRAERAGDGGAPAGGADVGPEEQTSWDIEEILAPVGEEREPGSTNALPDDDR